MAYLWQLHGDKVIYPKLVERTKTYSSVSRIVEKQGLLTAQTRAGFRYVQLFVIFL